MQSDIARQFDLPERQSKLATMLREEGLKDEQVYCICRSADVSRFMIGCDRCEEWYHGDCINVTENEATKIRKFYCKRCRDKHPGLEIMYKQKRPHHHHHHSSSSSKHHHDKEKHHDMDKSHNKDRPHDKNAQIIKSHHKHEKHSSSHSKSNRKRDACGECEACYIKEDCGRCEYCKDMPKFGGPHKIKQCCKKRQCHNFFHLSKKRSKESSSHHNHHHKVSRNDHSYNTTSSDSSHLKTAKKSSIHISSFAEFASISNKGPSNDDESIGPSKKGRELVDSAVAHSSAPRTSMFESTSPPPRAASREDTSPPHLKPQPQVRPQLVAKAKSNLSDSEGNRQAELQSDSRLFAILRDKNSSDNSLWEPKVQKTHKPRKDMCIIKSKKRKVRRDSSGGDSEDLNRTPEIAPTPQQCMGPKCVKAARPSSKYCSEECGLQLAEYRIYSLLPQRIQEWKITPCIAEDKDRKQLEKIRHQQLEARKALQLLDDKHQDLDVIIEQGKSAEIDPRADEETEEDISEGALVYCVTCGHEVPSRRAIKHMHSCYNKLESQMSFGSMYKTRIEGNNMFCDFYNASTGTYCKRLRVMCPEHTKEPKASITEVCGFPLTSKLFTENGKVCQVSKKKCLKHYCWDKLRKATIDMERVRQCLKLDELVEQERHMRLAMTNRSGVLALMLHSTYDHTIVDKLKKKQNVPNEHQYHQIDHPYYQKDAEKQDLNSSFNSDLGRNVSNKRSSYGSAEAAPDWQAKPREREDYYEKDQRSSYSKEERKRSQHVLNNKEEQTYKMTPVKDRQQPPPPHSKEAPEDHNQDQHYYYSSSHRNPDADEHQYYKSGERHFNEQNYHNKSDHHYYRQENARNKIHKNNQHHNMQPAPPQRYNPNKYYHGNKSSNKYHDHQYFSSAQAYNPHQKSHDHLYYSDRKK